MNSMNWLKIIEKPSEVDMVNQPVQVLTPEKKAYESKRRKELLGDSDEG